MFNQPCLSFQVLVVAPSHAACDAFTLALAKQWPRFVVQTLDRNIGSRYICPKIDFPEDAYTRR